MPTQFVFLDNYTFDEFQVQKVPEELQIQNGPVPKELQTKKLFETPHPDLVPHKAHIPELGFYVNATNILNI